MKKALLLAIVLFFSPCWALEAELQNRTVSAMHDYVHNNPKIDMVLENIGNGTAVIKNIGFEIDRNYVVEQSPGTILPGRTGLFSFRVSTMNCNDHGSDIDYNISIRYEKDAGQEDFVNYSGTFSVKNPLSMNTSRESIALYVGEVLQYSMIVRNSGSQKVSYNVSMDPGFYMQLVRDNDVYNVPDLDGQEFTVSYADTFTLKFIGTQIIQEYFDLVVTDVKCPSLSLSKKIFVKTYTKTGGIVDVSVSPDIDAYSLVLLAFLGVFAIAKIYKTD